MKYRLLIEYDGSEYSGWQRQPGLSTVQETLERALQITLRSPASLVASGRTDTGVHARGQVAHVETPAMVDPYRLRASLNGLVPNSIAIREVVRVADSFHARYDAIARCYHYYISTQPLALERRFRTAVFPAPDFERMNAAARALLGTHDFDAFCRTKSDIKNRVCSVSEASWFQERHEGAWYFRIVANRFLHGMVRAIVGTLLDIGHEKRAVDAIPAILASRDRRGAGPAAPAHGLVLEEVHYLATL